MKLDREFAVGGTAPVLAGRSSLASAARIAWKNPHLVTRIARAVSLAEANDESTPKGSATEVKRNAAARAGLPSIGQIRPWASKSCMLNGQHLRLGAQLDDLGQYIALSPRDPRSTA